LFIISSAATPVKFVLTKSVTQYYFWQSAQSPIAKSSIERGLPPLDPAKTPGLRPTDAARRNAMIGGSPSRNRFFQIDAAKVFCPKFFLAFCYNLLYNVEYHRFTYNECA